MTDIDDLAATADGLISIGQLTTWKSSPMKLAFAIPFAP